ncbi:MAG: Co2+/Mg2+ efflux protein ApaG [Phycisphaerales bacterium]
MVSSGSDANHGSDAVTQGIRVRVRPRFAPDHSDPSARRWVFTYHVRISNEGTEAATLLARHWRIVDAEGRTREVSGEGVIGLQPRLEPGQSHSYSSFCPLETAWGSMEGSYLMERDDGTRFRASVARFLLVSPPESRG